MNDPHQQWDEELRAALVQRADAIETVSPWAPPPEHQRTGRHLWRWLTPLAAAAAVLLIVIGVTATRLGADRDVHPVTPGPTPPTATATATTPPTTPISSPRRYANYSPSSTPPPTVVATVTPTRTTVVSVPAETSPPDGTTSPARATSTPCMRSYTYEDVTTDWSGVTGTVFAAQSELARCGGPDDVNWFPTGPFFPLKLTATTRIFVLRAGGNGDQALPFNKFAAYLVQPFTGLFVVTGPKTHPTTLTEIYHP